MVMSAECGKTNEMLPSYRFINKVMGEKAVAKREDRSWKSVRVGTQARV